MQHFVYIFYVTLINLLYGQETEAQQNGNKSQLVTKPIFPVPKSLFFPLHHGTSQCLRKPWFAMEVLKVLNEKGRRCQSPVTQNRVRQGPRIQ